MQFTTTPSRLIYIKPCQCWKLRNHSKLYTGSNQESEVKGSLDTLISDDHFKLYEQNLEIGEVKASSDGMLHPHSAC